MSLRLSILNGCLRAFEKPRLRRIPTPQLARHHFERAARIGFRWPSFTTRLPDTIGGIDALWVRRRSRSDRVILYFHGGAYVMGSPETHGAMAARMSWFSDCTVCLPRYRLAPEHPYPAALEDAWAAWRGMIGRGYPPDRIILGGDSAGGGLMLALLSRILRDGEPRPGAAFAFSPWTDLTLTGESLSGNARLDPLLPVERVEEARDYYLDGSDPNAPGASPLKAEFPNAPPTFLTAATTEILLDDTRRMADHLRHQGADVTLEIVPDAPHVWPLFQGWLPEAYTTLKSLAAFIQAAVPRVPADDS